MEILMNCPPRYFQANVQHRRDIGWGEAQPMLHQQHGANDAALGDAHLLVDVVDAKGGDCRPQQNENQLFPGKPLQQLFLPKRTLAHNKTSLYFWFYKV